jgi:phage repressor protein C with HTH and peptisase S24 domain
MVYPPHLNPPERAIDTLPRAITFGFDIARVRRVLGCEPDDLALFTVTGNAMEPSVCEGDMLLVDTTSNHHSEDSLYLLSRQGHLLVKRIQSNLDGGALLVRSDNPADKDALIAIKDMAKLDVSFVGRVVWTSGVA